MRDLLIDLCSSNTDKWSYASLELTRQLTVHSRERGEAIRCYKEGRIAAESRMNTASVRSFAPFPSCDMYIRKK